MKNLFRCFNSSPEIIRLMLMMYIRYLLSLRPLEDHVFERGIDHEGEVLEVFSTKRRGRVARTAVFPWIARG